MKKITIILASLLILGAIIFYSCKKDNTTNVVKANDKNALVASLKSYSKDFKCHNNKSWWGSFTNGVKNTMVVMGADVSAGLGTAATVFVAAGAYTVAGVLLH